MHHNKGRRCEVMEFTAVGRYMDGTTLVGYRLRNSAGVESFVNKDNVIRLISSGQVSNMRLRYEKDPETGITNVEIRGKGINLLSLDRYDIEKDQDPVHKNKLGRYRIVKRIMLKNNCVGYVIADEKGLEANVTKSKAFELCQKAMIHNAGVHKTLIPGTTEYSFSLVGIGTNLNELPKVYVDHNGKIIDTANRNQKYVLRALRMQKGGILYNNETGTQIGFAAGDYLVVTPNGGLTVMKADKCQGKMSKSLENSAMCDSYLDNVMNYPVELYGLPKKYLNKDVVSRWTIVDIKNNK